jgi:hypothetical protein
VGFLFLRQHAGVEKRHFMVKLYNHSSQLAVPGWTGAQESQGSVGPPPGPVVQTNPTPRLRTGDGPATCRLGLTRGDCAKRSQFHGQDARCGTNCAKQTQLGGFGGDEGCHCEQTKPIPGARDTPAFHYSIIRPIGRRSCQTKPISTKSRGAIVPNKANSWQGRVAAGRTCKTNPISRAGTGSCKTNPIWTGWAGSTTHERCQTNPIRGRAGCDEGGCPSKPNLPPRAQGPTGGIVRNKPNSARPTRRASALQTWGYDESGTQKAAAKTKPISGDATRARPLVQTNPISARAGLEGTRGRGTQGESCKTNPIWPLEDFGRRRPTLDQVEGRLHEEPRAIVRNEANSARAGTGGTRPGGRRSRTVVQTNPISTGLRRARRDERRETNPIRRPSHRSRRDRSCQTNPIPGRAERDRATGAWNAEQLCKTKPIWGGVSSRKSQVLRRAGSCSGFRLHTLHFKLGRGPFVRNKANCVGGPLELAGCVGYHSYLGNRPYKG